MEASQKTAEKSSKGRSLKDDPDLYDRLVHVGRVSKVVKGGRRFGYNALVVVGDRKGQIGFAHGKAREVPESVRKATDAAKNSMMRVPLSRGGTLHHDSKGRWGACSVILRSAKPGTGVIAGGPMRAAFEVLGLRDVVAKSLGSSNPHNMIRATFNALEKQRNPNTIARIRGKRVSQIIAAKNIVLSEKTREEREENEQKKTHSPKSQKSLGQKSLGQKSLGQKPPEKKPLAKKPIREK